MIKAIKLIDSVVRNIKPTDTRQNYWFIGYPGFGLRVGKTGGKTFVFKYTITSKAGRRVSRWISMGKYPGRTIQQARCEYSNLYEQVYDYGRDLVVERKDEAKKEKSSYTVTVFIKIYLEHAKLKGKASICEEERVFNLDVIPVIGKKELKEVDGSDINDIQSRILKRAQKNAIASRSGKVAVKNSLAYTRQLFNFAKKQGLVDSNPVEQVDSLGESGSRSRILSFEEIWSFWNSLEKLGVSPVTAKALKFLLVTMQRSNEVRNIRYSSLNLKDAIWQMERYETKNRKMHRVPLNRYALEIIDEVRGYTDASEYVFGATRVMSPPKMKSNMLIPLGESAMAQVIRKKRDQLRIPDFCPHDLRRTGATWITAVGLPKLYARLMLNHSDGERDVTGEVYVQYSYDFEKQRAVKVWEFILDQIVTCSSPKDIPTLEELRNRVRNSGLL